MQENERPRVLFGEASSGKRQGQTVGVLLCHGFGSTTQSLRPWAAWLEDIGCAVSLPLLPGHGTNWQQMAATSWRDWYDELDARANDLAARCGTIFVAGFSLGGCLALLLAERRPDISGIIVVNPSLAPETRLIYLTPVLRHVIPTTRAVISDIKKPGMTEEAYERTPLRCAAGLPRLWATVRDGLSEVKVPVLAFRSFEDHCTGPQSLDLLRRSLRPGLLTVCECPDSFHVAVLDNDAELVFRRSAEFIMQHVS